ncbi:hypothetical protein CD351_03375 [Erythrobacter sp. KY5]|nr:hypothetical protein CD351_03375 [Erythrobacter sp. KY5]
MRNERFIEAREEFVALTKDLKRSETPKDRRIELYANYWVAMLSTNPSQAEYWAGLAETEGLSGEGTISLPLPSAGRDEFDAEFEKIEREFERELSERNKV